MKLLILAVLTAAAAFAQCPANFVQVTGTMLNPDGTGVNGSLAIILNYVTAVSREAPSTAPLPITVTNGVMIAAANGGTVCLAPANYSVINYPNSSTTRGYTTYWPVPASGPVDYHSIEVVQPPTPPIFTLSATPPITYASGLIACPLCVRTDGAYPDPAWITALSATKLTGTPAAAQFWFSDGSGHAAGDTLVTHIPGGVSINSSVGIPTYITSGAPANNSRVTFTPASGNTSQDVYAVPLGAASGLFSRFRVFNGPDISNASAFQLEVQQNGLPATSSNVNMTTRLFGAGVPISQIFFGESATGGHALTQIGMLFNGLAIVNLGPNGLYVGMTPTSNTMEVVSPIPTTGITRAFIRRGAADTTASVLFQVDAWMNAVSGYQVGGVNGFTGTKVAGACTLTIAGGIITNVTGC